MSIVKKAILFLVQVSFRALCDLLVLIHYTIMSYPKRFVACALVVFITGPAAHNILQSQQTLHPAPLFPQYTAGLSHNSVTQQTSDSDQHFQAHTFPQPPRRDLFITVKNDYVSQDDPAMPYVDLDIAIAAQNKVSDSSEIIALQTILKQKGFYAGQIDGILGPNTRKAILAYEETQTPAKQPAEPSLTIADMQPASHQASAIPATSERVFEQNTIQPIHKTTAHDIETQIWGQELILQIENAFFERGLMRETPDGYSDTALNNAILLYEKSKNWPATGRITARLLEDLAVSPL